MMKNLLILAIALAPVWARAVAPEDYYAAGMDLFKNHDYDKAVQYFHAAVDQRPDYWQAYQFLGEAYYQTANRTEAIVAMEESLRLHPDNPDLRKFIDRIRSGSPWASRRRFSDYLSVISIILSLLTLGWTAYWTQRNSPRTKKPPLAP
jgi:tetratricopeptide (TPR) repeat protein